jgi:hypothetical protein
MAHDDQIPEWRMKTRDLMRKYAEQKENLMRLLDKKGVALAQPSSEESISIFSELKNVIERRQIPLYNNIYNYADLLQGTLPSGETNEERDLISATAHYLSFIHAKSGEMRINLQQQLELLSGPQIDIPHLRQAYVAEQGIFTLCTSEGKNTSTLITSVLQKVTASYQTIYVNAQTSTMTTWLALRRRRPALTQICLASMVACGLVMVFNLPGNELLREIRFYSDFLRKV